MVKKYKATHEDCPHCGHHDCLTQYADGSTYCHSCGRATNPEGVNYNADDDPGAYRYPDGMPDPDLLLSIPALEYRASTSRGLDQDTVTTYQIGVSDGDCYLPYYNNGQIIGYKIKHKPGHTAEIKGKVISWPYTYVGDKDYATFFGKQTCTSKKALLITEGELDAAAAYQQLDGRMGCVSVPFGAASALRYLRRELEWVESFDKVFICFDQDQPGRKAAEAAMDLLEPGKAFNVVLPTKDANDYLIQGLPDFYKYIYSAQPKQVPGIWDSTTLIEATLDRWRKEDARVGVSSGWTGLDNLIGGFRPGEVIVLASGTGQGKSSWARMLAFNLISAGHKVLYTPLEDDPRNTMLAFASLRDEFNYIKRGGNEAELRRTLEWVSERVTFTDAVGALPVDEYLEQVSYANRRKACRFIVLDHLTAMVSGTGNEEMLMSRLMGGLRSMARQFDLTVIAISHISKDKDDPDEVDPSLSRLKYASSIQQVADYVLGISRPRNSNVSRFNTLKASRTWGVFGSFSLKYNPDSMRMEDYVYEKEVKATKSKGKQQSKEPAEAKEPEVGV